MQLAYTRDVNDDVHSRIDLRNPHTARQWSYNADDVRPYRAEVRACIADQIAGAARILELGCGPGLLAETILERAPFAGYTLLDFSPAMLAMARRRIGSYPYTDFAFADFLDASWPEGLGTFDAVVTMQAVHELRHKRRAALLYEQAHGLLGPGGTLVVCDHSPMNETALNATPDEQHAMLASAGFADITTVITSGSLYVISARHR
jgi:SAM-dependent methyltransferase